MAFKTIFMNYFAQKVLLKKIHFHHITNYVDCVKNCCNLRLQKNFVISLSIKYPLNNYL